MRGNTMNEEMEVEMEYNRMFQCFRHNITKFSFQASPGSFFERIVFLLYVVYYVRGGARADF